MFNCFAVIFGGGVVGIFRSETAADNFIQMAGFDSATVKGMYLEASPF